MTKKLLLNENEYTLKNKRGIFTFNHPILDIRHHRRFPGKDNFKGKKPTRDVISTNTNSAAGLHAYSTCRFFIFSSSLRRGYTHARTHGVGVFVSQGDRLRGNRQNGNAIMQYTSTTVVIVITLITNNNNMFTVKKQK